MPHPRRLSVALLVAVWLSPALRAQDVGDEARFDPPQRGAYLGLQIDNRDDGMQVAEVLPGGAAAGAGLEEGDLIVGLADWRFRDGGQALPDYLAALIPRKTLVRVLRDGSELELPITPDPLLVVTARRIASVLARHRLFRRVEDGRLESLENDLVDAVRGAATREAAYEAMNQIIDRFGLSHTAILTPWVTANLFGDGGHFHLGMFVQRIDADGGARFFIRSMMFDSPARAAGLLIGDELVAVNGKAFATSPRRTLAGFEARRAMYAIQIEHDETVELSYRRERGGKVEKVKVTAAHALDAVGSARASVRVIGADTRTPVGYIHFWNVMSRDNVGVLKAALDHQFADVGALAIDLRGRGGNVAVIAALSRILAREERPVALLIDREARSAKEMLAHRLKGRANVTLVGETTAGAVLPANFIDLPGGAQLMLPVGLGDTAIRLFTRGQRLEGRGAVPDIKVDAPLPYRAGRDAILERALALLRRQAKGELLKL